MYTLRILCAVARHRSFSRAAQEFGITQSAASQRIGALEKRLGVTLIDRSVRPLALTEAGEVFLRGCSGLIEQYERLEARVTRFQPQLEGRIVVDAIYSAGIQLLSNVKQLFSARYPRVTVTIEYKHPEEVYEAVRRQRCDLGIVSYPEQSRDIAAIALRDEPMAIVCAPQHPLAQKDAINAEDLDGLRMVGFESTLPVNRYLKRYLRQHGVAATFTNVFDNVDTIKSAVAVTDQVAILPRLLVEREVAAGTLAVVDLHPQIVRPMGIIHLRHHRRAGRNGKDNHEREFSAVVEAFVAFLLQHAQRDAEAHGAVPASASENVQLVGDRA